MMLRVYSWLLAQGSLTLGHTAGNIWGTREQIWVCHTLSNLPTHCIISLLTAGIFKALISVSLTFII